MRNVVPASQARRTGWRKISTRVSRTDEPNWRGFAPGNFAFKVLRTRLFGGKAPASNKLFHAWYKEVKHAGRVTRASPLAR
jgi:hypothetical protein